MATLLHIETSTTVCSVVVSHDSQILFEQVETEGPSHAVKLPLFIESALSFIKQKGLTLEGVVVSSGPGSYTGLRIGVSSAKGLCYGLDVPLIAIDTLALLAARCKKQTSGLEGLIVPMIDARRMEVYTGIYSETLEVVEPISAKIIDSSSFEELLSKNRLYFCGNGSEKCKSVITHSHAIFVDSIVPLAHEMVDFAESAFAKKQFEDVAYYEPFYLKEFQATTPKQKL